MKREKENGKRTPRVGKKSVIAGLLLLVFCVMSWGLVLTGHKTKAEEFREQKQIAGEKFDKQIYDEALSGYKACLQTSPNDLECMARVAEIYYLTGEDNNCIAWCERVLHQEPKNLKIRLLEARSYDNKENVKTAIAVLQKSGAGDGTKVDRTERDEYLWELKGRYDLDYSTYQIVYPWFCLPDGEQAATATDENRMMTCTADGKEILNGTWQYLGACADEETLFPVQEGSDWYFADETGERRLVPNGAYTSLRHFSEGLAPATRKSAPEPNAPAVAGYLDKAMQEKRFEFQETYPLVDGFALAKKNNTYFVLDSALQEVTACEFTAVKTDDYGNAQKYGMLLGRLPGTLEQWAIYAPNGIRVNNFSAEDLKLPESKGGALAFRKGNLWGFVSLNGSVLIEPQFEDAISFSLGMAAVKKDGKWGYIDQTGAFLIAPAFEEAGPLSSVGTAFVKDDTGYSRLTLSRYQNSNSQMILN